MNLIKSLAGGRLFSTFFASAVILTSATSDFLQAQTTNPIPTLHIKADQILTKVSPMLYGLMTEEINFSYEGGIYGELIRNRTFKADARIPCSGR